MYACIHALQDNYAFSGRPLVVRNASQNWPASQTFSFAFFSDLYKRLDSPVLYNNQEDCQFFSWDFKEFGNMNEVFDMDKGRLKIAAYTI